MHTISGWNVLTAGYYSSYIYVYTYLLNQYIRLWWISATQVRWTQRFTRSPCTLLTRIWSRDIPRCYVCNTLSLRRHEHWHWSRMQNWATAGDTADLTRVPIQHISASDFIEGFISHFLLVLDFLIIISRSYIRKPIQPALLTPSQCRISEPHGKAVKSRQLFVFIVSGFDVFFTSAVARGQHCTNGILSPFSFNWFTMWFLLKC